MRGVEQIPWLYDALAALAERGEIGRWRRWLTAGAHGRTLDVGTGTGRNLPLFPAGTFVVAVDPSLLALRRARRRAPRVAVIAASAEALPFRDGVFDTIASSLAFSVDDTDGYMVSTQPASWTAVFGFYTPTMRKADLIPGQVRLLGSLLAKAGESKVARVILATDRDGTYEPRATPRSGASPKP